MELSEQHLTHEEVKSGKTELDISEFMVTKNLFFLNVPLILGARLLPWQTLRLCKITLKCS